MLPRHISMQSSALRGGDAAVLQRSKEGERSRGSSRAQSVILNYRSVLNYISNILVYRVLIAQYIALLMISLLATQ